MGLFDTFKGITGGGLFSKKFRKNASSFLTGTPEREYQQSLLSPEQQQLDAQRQKALRQSGAGGAFGDVADYYRSILNNDPRAFAQFEAPEQRRFSEDIIPGLSEQFAGMGSGGLSSSGFRNAAVSAGTDLSERLGAIRANLRQSAASGFANLGNQALQPTVENIYRPAQPGFLENIAPTAASAAAAYFGMPPQVGNTALNFATNQLSNKGKSSPYGKPQSNFNLPNRSF